MTFRVDAVRETLYSDFTMTNTIKRPSRVTVKNEAGEVVLSHHYGTRQADFALSEKLRQEAINLDPAFVWRKDWSVELTD